MHVDVHWGHAEVFYAKSTRLLSIEFDVRARKRQFEKKKKNKRGRKAHPMPDTGRKQSLCLSAQ